MVSLHVLTPGQSALRKDTTEESEYAGLPRRRFLQPVVFVPRWVDLKRDQEFPDAGFIVACHTSTPIHSSSPPCARLTLHRPPRTSRHFRTPWSATSARAQAHIANPIRVLASRSREFLEMRRIQYLTIATFWLSTALSELFAPQATVVIVKRTIPRGFSS